MAGWGLKDNTIAAVEFAHKHGLPYWRLEDGFLRSVGLGVDGDTALSMVLDNEGIYYDARRPSRLENLLEGETAELGDAALLARAENAMEAIRDAMRNAHAHLDYIDYLIDTRNWLAGATMSMADLAAAAQISVADYLGGIEWKGHEQTRAWYSMFKSRPSFRPLLSERMGHIKPPPHYERIDF